MNHSDQYIKAHEAIDALNSQDPNSTEIEGKLIPTELLYSQRMSEELFNFIPEASDELKIAVRAQHIARWKSPRSNYPEGRSGYLQWRQELYGLHAQYASEELRKNNLDEEFITSVAEIIKDKVKRNSSDTQTLEDIACLVFLRHYFADFVEKHEKEKLFRIVVKTWNKMSEEAQKRALTIQFSDEHLALLQEALEL